MSVTELSEWLHIYGDEPFGDVRADLRAGIIAREIRACMSSSGKTWSVLDFMPIVKKQVERTRKAQSAQEVAAGINAMMFRVSKGKARVASPEN